MKILFLNKLNTLWARKIDELKKEFPQDEFISYNDTDQLEKHLMDADGVVTIRISKEQIELAKNLKVAFLPYAGMDMLPFDDLKEKGIIISNSHGNAPVVAERALALTLALLGKVIEYHNDLKEGIWHGFWVGNGLDDTWTSLFQKACGIIGAGTIGYYIAKMLKVFDCDVYGYKKHKIDNIPEYYDEIYYDMDKVIDKSDIIYVCLPLTQETVGIIDEKKLSRMKDKYLINVGRGVIIDEKALFDALSKKILRGAGIDVWYNYPKSKEINQPSRYPFHTLPNVVLSPHVAGFTSYAVAENVIETIANIKNFLRKGNPKTTISIDDRY